METKNKEKLKLLSLAYYQKVQKLRQLEAELNEIKANLIVEMRKKEVEKITIRDYQILRISKHEYIPNEEAYPLLEKYYPEIFEKKLNKKKLNQFAELIIANHPEIPLKEAITEYLQLRTVTEKTV